MGIIAQRLVKKICPYCAQVFEIDAADLIELGLNTGKEGMVKLRHGKGCVKCRNTGYLGRTGLFEILPFSEGMKQLTSNEASLSQLRKRASMEGLTLLRENAIKKLLKGHTTYQEILRVTWDQA